MANWRLNADKTEKTTPASDDILMIEDSADTYNVKYIKYSTVETMAETSVSNALPIGSIFDNASATLTNSLLCNGETIGDVGSGADNESADYETLFGILKDRTDYGNAGTEVWADGDVVYLPNKVYEFIVVQLSATQTANLSGGDHVEFDTVASGNMTLSTGAGQADGKVSVKKNKTYSGAFSFGLTGSADSANLAIQAYISGGAAISAVSAQLRPYTITGDVAYAGNLLFTHTPIADGQIEMYLSASTNVTEIRQNNTFLKLETIGITKENTFIRYK